MTAIMHDASWPGKCPMHHGRHYDAFMDTPSNRLRIAREKAGYAHAKDAAEAMGVPVATYIQNENGARGISAQKATRYARFFRTTPEWILYGNNDADPATPGIDELEEMVRDALFEVATLGTRIADLPRIVAPSLYEQLERFRADRAKKD
jgi:transcriptional regulator with XRE-family HTH domain